jgi:hypothetical protein
MFGMAAHVVVMTIQPTVGNRRLERSALNPKPSNGACKCLPGHHQCGPIDGLSTLQSCLSCAEYLVKVTTSKHAGFSTEPMGHRQPGWPPTQNHFKVARKPPSAASTTTHRPPGP